MGKRRQFSHSEGARFERLLLLSPAIVSRRRAWLCRCDCGQSTTVREADLLRGFSRSCGCLKQELDHTRNLTHGHARIGKKTAEYKAWRNMIARCHNPKNTMYHHYGGRGISVCERWRASYVLFLEDVGLKPSPAHSIDRIENDGNYEKSNCQWATMDVQGRNRRTKTILSFNGQEKNLIDWASETGLSRTTIYYRLRRGWSVERALSTTQAVNA